MVDMGQALSVQDRRDIVSRAPWPTPAIAILVDPQGSEFFLTVDDKPSPARAEAFRFVSARAAAHAVQRLYGCTPSKLFDSLIEDIQARETYTGWTSRIEEID